MRNKKGLTLIELLAVIAIIAILFVLLIPQINNAIDKSRQTGVMTDFRDYETNIKSYLMSTDETALNAENLNRSLPNNLQFNNEESEKTNPYGNPYILTETSDGFKVSSFDKKGEEQSLKIYYLDGELTKELVGFNSESNNNAEEDYSEFLYREENGGMTIYGYTGTNKNITIPNRIKGKVVLKLDADTFLNHALESVVLPNQIKEIGASAFNGNNLTSISLPEGIVSIGNSAFAHNPLTSVVLPNTLEELGTWAFQQNNITSVQLSTNPNFKTIKDGTFSKNYITSLVIPSNIESIGAYAFEVNDITNIEFNEGLIEIGKDVFTDNEIKTVILPSTLKIVGQAAFSYNEIDTVVLNEGLETLKYFAFYDNDITSVRIPSSMQNVLNSYAFHNNPRLENVQNCSVLDVVPIFNSTPTIVGC